MRLPKPDYTSPGYRCWHIEPNVALWCSPSTKSNNRRWYVMFNGNTLGGYVSGSWRWDVSREQAALFFQMITINRSKANDTSQTNPESVRAA